MTTRSLALSQRLGGSSAGRWLFSRLLCRQAPYLASITPLIETRARPLRGAPAHSTGVEFGLKLPTGHFTEPFASGPQQGATLDRGVQLGTGTTDLLLGVYNFDAISQDWGYFAQALLQQSLDSRDGFKPGTGLNVSFGVRYTANGTFQPQVQINARAEKREQGINADAENSGATLVYLSPGLTWKFTPRLSAYTFLQVPLDQRVSGLQLEATQFISVGLHYHF